MLIDIQNCDTLEECSDLQKNKYFMEGLLQQFEMPKNTLELAPKSRVIHAEQTEFYDEYVPTEPNRIESLNIWTVKRSFPIDKFHLVICYASNEKGRDYTSKIIIPSNLERG